MAVRWNLKPVSKKANITQAQADKAVRGYKRKRK
jgi:hypothetical protein